MARRDKGFRVALALFALSTAATVPAFGGSVVIGSAVAGLNAVVGNEALIPGATIITGDKLQVANGAAIVTTGNGSRMVFGRDTVASFDRDANIISATLTKGSVSVYHAAADKTGLRLRVGDGNVFPAGGFATIGEVAMIGNNLLVSTQEGEMRLEGDGKSVIVPKGRSMTIVAKSARTPDAAGGGGHYGNSIAAGIAAAAGITAAILAGISLSHSNDARDAASAADSAANSAAAAANSAAAEAASAAAAASAALSTAALSLSNSITAICAIDASSGGSTNPPSPFVPVGGSCPQ